METLIYDDVRVLLVDQNHSVRQLMRGALRSVGIHDVVPCKHVQEANTVLDEGEVEVDLVLFSVDGERDAALSAVRDIRHERLGTNPFLVIMAHTWNPEVRFAQPILNSGTDDLVAAPLSAQILMTRIANLVRNRKVFVATMSYVGPERRSQRRFDPDDLPGIQVPNSLRFKAMLDDAARADDGAIEHALHTIHTHRVCRIAHRICIETHRLEEAARHETNQPLSQRKLREIAVLVAMAKQQILARDLDGLARIGDSMGYVTDAILAHGEPCARDLEILRLHGHAIAATVHGHDGAGDLLAGALTQAAALVKRTLH